MRILVFGAGVSPLKDLSRGYNGHMFDFVEEITDVSMISLGGDSKLAVNKSYEMDNYHSIILNDTAATYNYLWSETSWDTNWFSSPFDMRNASNHNLFFNIAKGFSIPTAVETSPTFNDGKVTVNRVFPKGKEVKFLFMGGSIYLIGHSYGIEVSEARNLIRFSNRLKVSALLFTMIHTLREVKGSGKIKNQFYLKNVESVIDWNSIPEKYVKAYLDHVLLVSKNVINR